MATYPAMRRLESMRSGKPPVRLRLAAASSAAVGPSRTKRSISARITPSASPACSALVWRAATKGPSAAMGKK